MSMELLLPAGKPDSLKAAIANGADAVYLAGSAYGARAGAGNFDESEMRSAVKLCKKFGVRLYVAMNTLIADEEMSDALDYVKFLYDLGADGLIVQDLGLAGAVKKLLPDFSLHASTQMTIHNVRGARWAYRFGFKRVILAREMTLSEIKKIRETVPELELEVFCHGALCICYSGQCLMSSLIGGRSGNRGQCAQPCRLPYGFIYGFEQKRTKKDAHLLSPRDLNTLNELKSLMDLGVASVKVEGRMRRPEYVATVGRVYRRAIDQLRRGLPPLNEKDEAIVEQVFNRNFSEGYLHGNPGIDLMSHDKPNNRGVFIGRVAAVDKKKVFIRLEKDLFAGDGIEIWVKVGGRLGTTVDELKVNRKKTVKAKNGELCEIFFPGRVQIGDRVFKTYDTHLMSRAMNSFDRLDDEIGIDYHLTAKVGENLVVSANDAMGHEVKIISPYVVDEAKNRATDEDMIKKQLSRLGGSGYRFRDLTLKREGNIMIPASVLNQLRREIVMAFDHRIFDRYPSVKNFRFQEKKKTVLNIDDERKKNNVPDISVKVRDLFQLRAALESGADRVCFAPHFGLAFPDREELTELAGLNEEFERKLCFVLPQVSQDEKNEVFFTQIENALAAGFRDFLVGQAADIDLKESYPEIESISSDYSANAFNRYTADILTSLGFDSVTASLEMTKEQLERFAKGRGLREVIVFGAMQMMVSRHCLIGAVAGKDRRKVPCGLNCRNCRYRLVDRMGMEFPVVGDLYHNCHIFNCRDLCLLDEIDHLKGFSSWRIEGQFYDLGTLKELIALFKTGREQILSGLEFQKELLTDELAKLPNPGFTKGHFYRGVK